MMKKPEVKNNKNGQNGKKKGSHKKQGGNWTDLINRALQ